MDVKKKFWDEISHLVPENAILCTNTSGMSITEMATAVYRPERFTGMHWFNPPHIVQLVEVTKGAKTYRKPSPASSPTVSRTPCCGKLPTW